MEKEKDGVWRTIRGRRIFIAEGQSLGEAMSKSGKFNRSDIREAKAGLSQIDRFDRTNSQSLKQRQKAIKDMRKKDTRYSNSVYTPISRQDEKLVANQDAHIEGGGQTRVQRNWNKYSEEDRREHRHELIQKKLADFKAKKQSNNKIEENESKFLQKRQKEIEYERANNKYTGERETNNDGSYKYEKERELYERAKNNPESIDPMTENSTDWEALEKKYGNNESYPRAKGATKFEDLGLEVSDKKAFSDYLQDKYGTDDFKIINFDNKENAKQIYEDFKNKDSEKFIQNTNMYGGTREYNKEQLDKMAEQGIRPMKNSYTGGGWEGVNSRQNLSTSEQAKAITSEMKKQFPDVKIARSSQNYSGGSSIDFNIMSSDKDLYISDKDIDKLGSEQLFNTDITRGWGFERWAKENIPTFEKEHSYSVDDVKRYAKEELKNMKAHDNQNVRGDEWYLSDYGKKVVSALNKEANSYTFDDSDGSIDYFHHGTYMDISIGKWNKPYQVNESKKIKDYVSKKKSNH